ncbi:DUF3575 domain-containing protein [Cyclobacterium jeungdonense]|uniref:DUF3575 domain-containing protein n=1 Tax=Cyclobacterium jeungdonense TaxID=708087 RepID=A0ABT8CB36_9BACT|nr:DUF3575 domain-containing protein [Cyclobacterium jeungdonense]MDN3689174.1 DUF3575 domain-containing protein [Cyclobacterium jeungdonense]
MRKLQHFLIFTIFFGFLVSSAYSQSPEYPISPANEVKLNIANTIIIGSLELGYERFLDQNQSLGLEVLFMDRFAYVSDSGDGQDFKATSLILAYNYYFVTESNPSGFYVHPFLKYRNGTFTEVDENSTVQETNLNSFMVGFGAGYKWVHNEKFILGPYVNIARGFNEEVSDRFDPVELNAGFSVGFRF